MTREELVGALADILDSCSESGPVPGKDVLDELADRWAGDWDEDEIAEEGFVLKTERLYYEAGEIVRDYWADAQDYADDLRYESARDR